MDLGIEEERGLVEKGEKCEQARWKGREGRGGEGMGWKDEIKVNQETLGVGSSGGGGSINFVANVGARDGEEKVAHGKGKGRGARSDSLEEVEGL